LKANHFVNFISILLRSLVLFLALCSIAISSSAQTSPQKIDIVDMFVQVLNNSESSPEYVFDNYLVQSNKLEGKSLLTYLSNRFPEKVNANGSITIPGNLIFSNCVFVKSLDLEKFNFKNLSLSNSFFDNQKFNNCFFESLVLDQNKISNALELSNSKLNVIEIKGNVVDYEIYITKDSIVGDTYIENNEVSDGEIVISKFYSNGSVTLGNNQVSGILIEDSDFNIPEYGEFNNYKLAENSSSDLYLTGNSFRGDSTSKVYFSKGNYLNLDLRDNQFEVNVFFVENKIEERFFLVNNSFLGHVSFEKFLFSETWNELYWKQLSGYKLRFADYAGETKEELSDEIGFSNLINIYKGLHTIFLSRGDLESANACYSEMKQVQGRRLKYLFKEDSTFGNFLRWQLNVLLKIYTNHGTDPGLAVVMSFFVILLFAMLYLFFPSEWDRDSVTRLLISYEQFLQRKKKANVAPLLVVFGSVTLTLINAVTLSINSFVTLGFGSIPTKGFARYLCIIEGFIGWFLLSIFTVALINQVLA